MCPPRCGRRSLPRLERPRRVRVGPRNPGVLNAREIYSSNADGSDPQPLTADPSFRAEQPAYSPDGSKIAFTRNNDIYVMNANGTGEVPITGIEGPDRDPAWSPDGTQIVYVSNHTVSGGGTTGFELFITPAGGGGQRQVTDTPNNATSDAPAWSPAGDQIAYQSNADGTFEVYTIAATAPTGFGVRRTANEVGQNYQHPSWVPGRLADRLRARRRHERGRHHEGDLDDEGGRHRSRPAHGQRLL